MHFDQNSGHVSRIATFVVICLDGTDISKFLESKKLLTVKFFQIVR